MLWSMAYRVQSFLPWQKQGLWERLLTEAQRKADTASKMEWEVPFVDGNSVRVYQQVAGGKGGMETRR